METIEKAKSLGLEIGHEEALRFWARFLQIILIIVNLLVIILSFANLMDNNVGDEGILYILLGIVGIIISLSTYYAVVVFIDISINLKLRNHKLLLGKDDGE